MTRLRRLWRDPWGRPRWLVLITWLYLAWSIVPVVIAVQFSFNKGKSKSVWQGFSMRWYTTDPRQSVLHDPSLHSALTNSLKLAALTMLIATPLGVALAVGLARWRSRASSGAQGLMLFPLITPEIVMGVSLFLVFTSLYRTISLGFWAQLLGHVTFNISAVVIIVRGRLLAIGTQYEEAARDLGATRLQALVHVLVPNLMPAIFASVMVVFATSIDDFVISSYLSANAGDQTVPMKIYSTGRAASTPALNALASIMLVFTLVAVAAAAVVLRTLRHRGGGEGGSAALVTLST